MQFPSRTLQQLLVLSVAILAPVECACIPTSLPALTSTSAAVATSTSTSGLLLTPVAIQLLEASKSSTTSTAKATSTAAANVRPVFVASKATSSSSIKATSTGIAKVKRAIVHSRHTATGRAILKKQAEAEQLLREQAEESLKASAATLKFGSHKQAELLNNVSFGRATPKVAKGLISNLRLSVSSAVKPLVKSLSFHESAKTASVALQFGINRERAQQIL